MSLKIKINLSIIILIVLAILFSIFFISPTFLEIKKSSRNILSQKEKITSLGAKAENLNKFRTYYQEIKPNLEKIDKLFIDPEAPVDFISFLEKTSKDCQITIDISPALPMEMEKDPWPSLIFQITSTSSFPNFLKFLEKLESSNYLIEIQNLNIRRLDKTELKDKLSLGDVKTNFSIKVYTK